MEMPTTIYTIASGSFGASHCTSVHLTLEDLAMEVNTIISEDEYFMDEVRHQWNAEATKINKNLNIDSIPLKKDDEDVDFVEFLKNFPSECGWAWDNGFDDASTAKYLNITVHPWSNTRFQTIA